MKATELLVNQHREIEQLEEQLEGVEEGDEKIVREELARNLVAHMAIEEELFYPAMREALPQQIALAEVQHASARYALAQVLAAAPGDPMFHAKVAVLDTMVRLHVEMEEKDILPKAEGVIGADQLQQLTRRMEARHEEVVSRDFMPVLKQRLQQEMPPMLVPRGAGKQAAKKRTVRATAKKAAPAPKRGAGAKRGAAVKRPTETKRATGTKRAAPTTRRTGMAGRPTTKRGTRKQSAAK